MTMRVLQTYTGEGFIAEAVQHEDGRVVIEAADADIDADGANGQHGKAAAYRSNDKGSEWLANGGMGIQSGRVVFIQPWGEDIVITRDGAPLVMSNGVIPSRTAYRFPDTSANDFEAYIDSETVPYIVVSSTLRDRVAGVVLGCRAKAINLRTGKVAYGLVADIGPRNKVGEVSIEMARRLGIPDSPRHGGVDNPVIRYEFEPGVPATVNGVVYRLLAKDGSYSK